MGSVIGGAVSAVIFPAGQYIVTGHLKLDAGTIIPTAIAAGVGTFGAMLGNALLQGNPRSG
jgi:hypothetical protein